MRRRAFVVQLSSVGMGAITTSACGEFDSGPRGFPLRDVLRWEPADIVQDVAFAVADLAVFDHLDATCPSCQHAFRVFSLVVSVASTLSVSCPYCGMGTLVTARVARLLFDQLRAAAIKYALALPIRAGEYFVHEVGPALMDGSTVSASRCTVALDVAAREPRRIVNRRLPAVPRRIVFHTEIVGAARAGSVMHVWRCNGVVTDRIRLAVDSPRFRTWSMKEHLAPGTWIATVETLSGSLLGQADWIIE